MIDMNGELSKITDNDLEKPLAALVNPRKTKVKIKDMADYYEIFFGAERTVLFFSEEFPDMMDKDVISAYSYLLQDFDGQEKDSLADYIAKGIKAQLIFRRRNNKKDYSMGEIHSCLLLLKKLAIQHHSSDGKGYLKWIRAFFEGRLPRTPMENWIYILKNEL